MGAIRLLNSLTAQLPEVRKPWIPAEVSSNDASRPILNDAVEVTLAEYDYSSRDVITAHKLKDYRQRSFRLSLLPKCTDLFDLLLEGSEYWSELLNNEVHFS